MRKQIIGIIGTIAVLYAVAGCARATESATRTDDLKPITMESGVTNLVVTPSEVDPKSVKLTAIESPQPNLIFNYVGKTPEQVRAIHRSHAPVLVVKHGVVFAKAPACAGHKSFIGPDGHGDFDGLVLIFDDLDQARIAERVLKREDKKPE